MIGENVPFSIDPLTAKSTVTDEVALNAIKREITNILDSYVGWFDPFSELIQNALDSVDEKAKHDPKHSGHIRIIIDLKSNTLTVTDNGTGLTEEKFQKFLAPSFSFKSGGTTRGYKGVGATFLAYGFNDIQVCTKSDAFSAVGRMQDARNWLTDESPSGNPKLTDDPRGSLDPSFKSNSHGVSISMSFDKTTRPGKLSWLGATTAEQWCPILSAKTGPGCIPGRDDLGAEIIVIDEAGNETTAVLDALSYAWPHQALRKVRSLQEIQQSDARMLKKHGADFTRPSSMRNLDAIYYFGDFKDAATDFSLTADETAFLEKYSAYIYVCYVNSAKVWTKLNEDLNIRSGQTVFGPGIQIAANNMPQGELNLIPLKRDIGRQRQLQFVFHLNGIRSDLGRKGFQKEIVASLEQLADRMFRSTLQKYTRALKPASGAPVDLDRTHKMENWKKEFEEHEKKHPLDLVHESFFLPKRKISITSLPTREQDVISLFNQLIAGGVIRGIEIMSTNERFTYDAMYRLVFGNESEIYEYDEDSNPLGIDSEHIMPGFRSHPKILEYKFDLDGLIEDIESDDKNTNDIDMVVCWSVGDEYLSNYSIISLLDPDNIGDRRIHGVTHTLHSSAHGQKEFDMIVLEDLINYLNDAESEVERQHEKYEDV